MAVDRLAAMLPNYFDQPVAARGIEVCGIDLSPAMLERLRAKPGGTDLTVAVASFTQTRVPG